MLPTNKADNALIMQMGHLKYFNQYFTQSYLRDIGASSHHLYITSDDEIKEGDWYISTRNIHGNVLHQCDRIKQPNKNGVDSIYDYNIVDKDSIMIDKDLCKKIIATTDPELKFGDSFFNEFLKSLPQPSKAFIEKYCEVGGVDEVMVEYEINYCTHKCIGTQLTSGICSCHKDLTRLKLKINSHNEITIHPIKDSWSREELSILKGSTGNHLKFIYERMAFHHKENINYDYMIKLKEIVDFVDLNL